MPGSLFSGRRTEVSARALYQVWVKLLEHQTPPARLLYLFKLKVHRGRWAPRPGSGEPLRRAIMSSRCIGKFTVLRQ